MGPVSDRLAVLVTEHSKLVIVVSLVVVVLLSAGATSVEQSSSLSQFESDGPEAEALDYVETNFTGGDDDTTTVQVIVRDENDNVLDRESLLRSLRYQRSLRDDESVNVTLAENRSVVGVSNAVAIAAVRT
ncbi:Patched family protein, partial [Halobacteriales archaeon SW_7_71_33]